MRMNHTILQTNHLEQTKNFSCEDLGFHPGHHLAFDFPGYWLYGSEPGEAIVHLVGVADVPGPVDHFAFRGGDHAQQVSAIKAAGLEYRENDVPGRPIRQVFVRGPEAVTVELQFPV